MAKVPDEADALSKLLKVIGPEGVALELGKTVSKASPLFVPPPDPVTTCKVVVLIDASVFWVHPVGAAA